jgi:glycosyltransferase involved in cell wall biosynthesis
MPSASARLHDQLDGVFDPRDCNGTTRVVAYPAHGRWCFSPQLYRGVRWHAQHADFVSLHSLYSYPVLAGYALARRFGTRFGVWPHGVLAPVQRGAHAGRKLLYDSLCARRILANASVLFYSAEGERREGGPLALTAPSVVIPHGIDVRPFERLPPRGAFRRRFLDGHDGPVVLYLGRLNAKKGLDVLIDAMAALVQTHPTARLVIAGGGDPPSFANRVREWVRQAGIQPAVVLTGALDEADRVAAFADCDVFVTPSAAENFGFSVFEAMAARRPVICSDGLNYADDIRRADAGVVVTRTAEEFRAAIECLLRDGERRESLGRNGAGLARRFTWDNSARLLEIALRCLADNQPFPEELKPLPAVRASA